MAEVIEIENFSAPEVSVYARLTEHQLRREGNAGVFIAESTRVIEQALRADLRPLSFLMERRHIGGKAKDILVRCSGVPVYTASDEALSALTGFTLSRGVLAAFPRPAERRIPDVLNGARRVAVLENMTDAANLGAIFRSAAALGMDAVLLSPECCDPLGRRAVRVSMGGVFQVPWARFQSWPEGITELNREGFFTAALALREDALRLDSVRIPARGKAALVLGTEGEGLLEETIRLCRASVVIPMKNGADSLNVAAAAAIAFWQMRIPDEPSNI